MFLEISQIKVDKKNKKLLRKVKKMKAGEEMELHNYDIICYDKEFYLLINPQTGIHEKHYNEIKGWIINGGELD